MAFLIPFLIGALVVAAIAVLLRPRPPQTKPAALEDLSFPTAETGRPVPVIFGTVRLKSPNVVWYGDLRYSRVRSQGTTIGYKYFIGMHQIYCHGPIDELQAIFVDEKIAWQGSVTANQTLNIDEPGLFGGRKKQGGIVGLVDVEFGEVAQPQNTYLQGQLGTNIPAFRGNFGLVLNQVYVTAITTQIKPWSALMRRQADSAWFPATANINNGSSNGAHIIREALTNVDWGLGYPISDIDDVSFRAAAQTLFDEGFGLSLPYVAQNQVEEFIQNIGSHISGLVYVDRFDGLFHLRLFRDDYVIDDLFVLNNSNCEVTRFERPSPSDLITEINLVYRERGAVVDNSISLQDLAAQEAQGAVVSQTVNYPGIDSHDLAARVADRDLLQLASPLASVQIRATRAAFRLQEGDVVRLQYDDDSLGSIDIVIRIAELDLGTLADGEIIIDGTEDVFSLGTTTYLGEQDNQWVDPVQPAVEATDKTLLELTYWDVLNILGTAEAQTLTATSAYLQTRVGLPSVASPNYELFTALPTELFINIDTSGYPPTASLLQDVTQLETSLQIQPTNLVSEDIEDIELGTYIAINNELMQVTAIDLAGSPNTITVSRSVIDSIPASHSQNDTVYFFQNFTAFDPRRYATGQEIRAKIIVETGISQLDIATADISTLTFVGRQNKPYPPANVRFNNNYFPVSLNALSVISITWVERNRLTQGLNLVAWDDATNFPFETGTTLTFQFFGETNNLLRTDTGITSQPHFYPIADELADSNLLTTPPSRDLVTTSLALATTETVYSGITDSSIPILTGASFRRMTNDWAMFVRATSYFLYFVNGTTGALTTASNTITQWEAIAQNSTTAFNGRSDAELILEENAGQQAGWAAIVPNIAATTVAPDAVDRTLQSIIDHRASSDQLITGFTSETQFQFVANGQSAIKGIAFFSHSVHFASRTDLAAGTFATTRRVVEEFYSANSQMLDDATVSSAFLPPPSVESPYQLYSTTAIRPFWSGVTFGSLLYMTYRGAGSQSFNTSGQFLDITNLLTGHISTVYSSHQVITKKFTVSGNTITEVARFTDFVFADRSNVADTQGVEWQDTAMRLVNSATGATTNTFTKFQINALACDWVDGHVFVIRRSDLAIVKLDLTGAELATLADPGFTTGPGLSHLYIADNFIYTRVGTNVLQIDKNLVGTSISLLSPTALRPTFAISGLPIDARPDSSLVHNWDGAQLPELYDENGGQSPATPAPQARLNGSLRIDVKSVRGGVESFNTLSHTIQRSGWGYNWGNFWGL